MIAVDTSALIAVILGEPRARECAECLATNSDLVMSAATLAEALVVSERRNRLDRMEDMIIDFKIRIIPATEDVAYRVGSIHARWGRGRHPASLNFGDCFAYDAAASNNCPLLFIGDDFAKTDIRSAL